MKALNAWEFRIIILPTDTNQEVPRREVEKFLLEKILPWAEARTYGVGAGIVEYPPAGWLLRFGLGATRRGQLISEAAAEELEMFIRENSDMLSPEVTVSFAPFNLD